MRPVVEDNATIGGLLVALLREEGYRALRAWDGREAMKMARDRAPDLIVLDLSLPYRDGVDVLRDLRANDDTAEAPIVVVSGQRDPADTGRPRARQRHRQPSRSTSTG